MRSALGSDHAGFELKVIISAYLKRSGAEVLDFGAAGPQSVDYPDFGERVARAVASGEAERGVLICGSGIGMSIVANRVPGVRAALVNEPLSARLSRQHNDANILVMGGRMIGAVMAEEITKVWFETAFEGGRHLMRLEKLKGIEERNP